MAIRTNAVAVGKLLSRVDPNVDMDSAIETASSFVDELCAPALKADGVTLYYGATRLELIERWLAAHFYSIPKPFNQTASARVGVNRTIETKVDLGFDVTRYGQTAMRLDTNGALARLNEMTKKGMTRIRPGVFYLGDNRPCDERRIP